MEDSNRQSKVYRPASESMDSRVHGYVFRVILSNHKAHNDEEADAEGKTKLYAVRFDSAKSFGLNVGELNDYPVSPHQLSTASLVGSCNGLICVSYMKNTVIIWNPWIRRCFMLPQSPSRNMSPCDMPRPYPKRYFHYGFGYNESSNDYNVVRLVHHSMPSALYPLLHGPFCEVKVYSLKYNSWRKLPNLPYHILDDSAAGVFVNSSLHWIAKKGGGIVVIDLKTEEYRVIPEPKFVEHDTWELSALDGCLCIIPSYFCNMVHPCDSVEVPLWVMNDYGVKNSWTKIVVRVPSGYGYTDIKPIKRNRKMDWQTYNGEEFQLFDIEEQRVVRRAKVAASSVILEGYECVGSLVQPCGGYSCETKWTKRKRAQKRKHAHLQP